MHRSVERKKEMKKSSNAGREIIPIFFAVDDNYAPYLGVCVRSLIHNASKSYDYKIHILIDDLSDENKGRLTSLQTENATVEFVNVASRLDAFGRLIHLRDYYTKATYYRFFIPDLFPQYAKGIYLDCDMLVLGDISELYRVDINGLLVAAAREEVMANVPVFGEYAEQVVGIPCEYYFNAGMLVMNLTEMRKIRIEEEFVELLSQIAFRVTQDQDYLNVICSGRSLILSQTWNKTAYPDENCEIPQIVHFKINYKPWRYDGVMCENEFWSYAKETAYYDDLRREKRDYGASDRERDRLMYENLMALARHELDAYYAETEDAPFEANAKRLYGV
ncbi:MAG: glycosyltransferase family 8 protein [Ruminococcaceae bacterium]|nr:glycosyltransferase family 8 protein [Oscillospiraceae bacterium]